MIGKSAAVLTLAAGVGLLTSAGTPKTPPPPAAPAVRVAAPTPPAPGSTERLLLAGDDGYIRERRTVGFTEWRFGTASAERRVRYTGLTAMWASPP